LTITRSFLSKFSHILLLHLLIDLQTTTMPRYSKRWHTRRRERQDTDPRTDGELFTTICREAHLYDLTTHHGPQLFNPQQDRLCICIAASDDIFWQPTHTSNNMLQTACLARPARGPKTWFKPQPARLCRLRLRCCREYRGSGARAGMGVVGS
jgi:hypothetical protein